MMILIFGFAASFNLITSADYTNVVADNAIWTEASWNTYANSLLSSTMLILGVDVEIHSLTETYYYWISVPLLVLYTLLMCVILLNLLIAIMSNTYSNIQEKERACSNYSRAAIVVEYEKLISSKHPWRDPNSKEYKKYSPTYLQILKPD